jgi:hypothetical protein
MSLTYRDIANALDANGITWDTYDAGAGVWALSVGHWYGKVLIGDGEWFWDEGFGKELIGGQVHIEDVATQDTLATFTDADSVVSYLLPLMGE